MSTSSKNLATSNRSSRRGSYNLSGIDFKKSGSPAIADKLTSDVFSDDFPPMDWADVGLLIPHEAIRRQMTAMAESVAALPDAATDDSDQTAWKATLFAEWYCDYFFDTVEEHHDAEEKIYFPWIKEKAAYPEKEFSKSHEELFATLTTIKEVCEKILNKKGKDCAEEIASLKDKVPTFNTDMRQHLKEEEQTIPAILRENFTQEEEGVIIEKILQAGGLSMTKVFLPAVVLAMQEWASKGFYDQFLESMPPPIKHLLFKYYLPDHMTFVIPMRDAPTLDEKPKLTKVGCCGISFCFPCIL
eukprot:CAMPEP_0197726070 /NCGR_PEP_ID=MMETSP1434-20131217/13382_1 /TAXON_ID=265543 /ORGANISM="Minutocellus polymorphus, Strain CCMP3303" /LENGTH=300 /DNA_ID=CAMNT_0043311883 /DNA_START=31 /DNA_END=933 /DNA_ORIENTATION=+